MEWRLRRGRRAAGFDRILPAMRRVSRGRAGSGAAAGGWLRLSPSRSARRRHSGQRVGTAPRMMGTKSAVVRGAIPPAPPRSRPPRAWAPHRRREIADMAKVAIALEINGETHDALVE